jgi:hypothetical protein
VAIRFRPAWQARPKRGARLRAVSARPALATAWAEWIAENALHGATRKDVIGALAQHGVSLPLAERLIDDIDRSPLLAAAKRLSVQGRKLALVQRLLTLQAAQAAHPGAVERRATPAAPEFFDRYYAPSVPVVFTDLVTTWPALSRWSPEYFAEHFGDVPLQMTDGREADPIYDARTDAHTRETTMRAFVERVRAAGESNDFYLVAKNKNIALPALGALLDDVRFPEGWFREEHLVGSSALWFGPAGTVTPLHHDASSILFCQVYGRKRLFLASPLEVSLFEGGLAMYSACDPEAPARDARFAHVIFKELVLEPGEALFIPAGWWHHVRALDVSISLAVNHFDRENNFDAWYRPGDVV